LIVFVEIRLLGILILLFVKNVLALDLMFLLETAPCNSWLLIIKHVQGYCSVTTRK
jgi:hypothetical protein